VGAGLPLATFWYAEGAAEVLRQKEEDQAKVECCRVKFPRPDFNLNSLERSSPRHYAPGGRDASSEARGGSRRGPSQRRIWVGAHALSDGEGSMPTRRGMQPGESAAK